MTAELKAEMRDSKSCSGLNQLRRNGRIPGVLYGMNQQNELIHVDQSDLIQVLRHNGKNGVLDLHLQGNRNEKVMIAEIQKDNIKGQILHLDLKRVNMNKPIHTQVPITLVGQADGAKQGGVLQFQLREVEVRCLPTQIPDSIPLYVSELNIGDSLTIADLDVPSGIEIQHESDEVIVSVAAPRMQPVEEDENDTIQEPEVVGAKDGPGLDEAK